MTEADLYRVLCGAMRAAWHVQRHEDRYSPDIPDSSFTYRGVTGWIENKSSDPPKRDTPFPMPKLRPGQLNWMRERSRHGGVCLIAWRIGQRVLFIDPLDVVEHDERHRLCDWAGLALSEADLTGADRQAGVYHAMHKAITACATRRNDGVIG